MTNITYTDTRPMHYDTGNISLQKALQLLR